MRGNKPKREKDRIPPLDPKSIEYVIYCRKSSIATSEKQIQSISDQLKLCIRHADEMDYKIMKKPDDFSDFEDSYQILKEDNEVHIEDRRIYQETRGLFVVKEEKSAQEPYQRPKWMKLIELVKKGKVKGILSYSSDRQARNMLE
jgi:DNA invertase Pin-like site-specific DNA recombinase